MLRNKKNKEEYLRRMAVHPYERPIRGPSSFGAPRAWYEKRFWKDENGQRWFIYEAFMGPWHILDAQKNILFEDGVTRIKNLGDKEAKRRYRKLKAIKIAKTVQTIEPLSFEYCVTLVRVDFAKDSGLLDIGADAFGWCNSMTEISLPASLKTIGQGTFYRCSSLTKVELQGSQLEEIGPFCFTWCTALTTIDLSRCQSMRIISEGAFFSCTSLTTLLLPPKLKEVHRDAFSRCTSLKEIFFPKTVRHVGIAALNGCSSLEMIEFGSFAAVTALMIYRSTARFRDCEKLCTIKWPLKDTNGAAIPKALWPRIMTSQLFRPHEGVPLAQVKRHLSFAFSFLCKIQHSGLWERNPSEKPAPRRSLRRRRAVVRLVDETPLDNNINNINTPHSNVKTKTKKQRK